MSRRSRFKNWKATNITEMKAFLGLLLHVGVVNLPNLRDCWSRDPFLQSNVIWKHGLSRDRFLLFLRFWDFKDETNPESRLQKISPLIDHLNNIMSKIYCHDEKLSLDESVVLWRGRLIFSQYIKNKRHKYWVWVVWVMRINQHYFRKIHLQRCILPRSTWLRANWCNSNEFANRFYWQRMHRICWQLLQLSPTYLAIKLKQNLHLCGTLRWDRKGNPKEVTKKKLQKDKMILRRAGTVSVSKWNDRRDVLSISNKHSV